MYSQSETDEKKLAQLTMDGLTQFGKNPKAAIKTFDQIIEISPSPRIYLLRGSSKAKLGDNEGAMVDYDKVIEMEPDMSFYYDRRGELKEKVGNYSAAIKDFSNAIELDSENARAYYHRGRIKYNVLNDTMAACEDWELARRLNFKEAIIASKKHCEEQIGWLHLDNSAILYANDVANNYHSIYLDGEIDFSTFPFIEVDTKFFGYKVFKKDANAKEGDHALTDLMNEHINIYESKHGRSLVSSNKIIHINGLEVNLWYIDIPDSENNPTLTFAYHYADFIHNDLFYRLMHSADIPEHEGDEEDFLIKIVSNFHFYESPIDLDKLEREFLIGKGFYEE